MDSSPDERVWFEQTPEGGPTDPMSECARMYANDNFTGRGRTRRWCLGLEWAAPTAFVLVGCISMHQKRLPSDHATNCSIRRADQGIQLDHTRKASMSTTNSKDDREQIIDHIHGLFQAFLRGDREAIRRGHTEDWHGFQLGSDRLVHGIDEYMPAADKVLATVKAKRYELVETQVDIYGDVAVVFYVAREWLDDGAGGEKTIMLRAVDIYRREGDGWNQAGSNICLIPAHPPAQSPPEKSGEQSELAPNQTAPRRLASSEREEILAARRALWAAWFANDAQTMAALLPEETMAIDPGVEAWADREEVIRRSKEFAASGAKMVRLEFPDTKMQVYGQVAMLYTTYLFETELDGKRTTTSGRGTEVFVHRNGKWMNSGWHLDSGA